MYIQNNIVFDVAEFEYYVSLTQFIKVRRGRFFLLLFLGSSETI